MILRNWKESPAVQALYVMTTDGRGDFVLKGRVSWGQKMGRGELLPALSALRTVGILHNQFGPGLSTSLDQLVPAVDKTFQVVGPNVWRSNVRTFFDVVDHAFGLKSIAYRDLSPHLKGGFLRALARVFADHQTFWEDHRLKIDPKDLAKLRQFPIRDPGIMDLANSNSGVNETLYAKIVQFMNAYRKTNYLRKWNGQKADGVLNMEQSSEGGDFSDSELPEPAEAT